MRARRRLPSQACSAEHCRSDAASSPRTRSTSGRWSRAFAGLWESFRWPDETVTRSFTIMTTTPNAEMSELHDRMPVILDQQDWPTWLGEAEGDGVALLRPAPDGLLRVWPVDRRVGSPRNNGPELLGTIAA